MKKSALCCIVITVGMVLVSTDVKAENFQGGLFFVVGSPKGAFSDNVDRNGYGVSVEGLYKKSGFPFGIGLDFMYMNYGSESRNERLSTTIPDLKVRVDNSNNIVGGNIVLRLQPIEGPVSPYIDGLFGFKYLFTETTIKEIKTLAADEEIASSTNFDDITLGYGIGGGVLVRVYISESSGPLQAPVSVYLDLKGRYMYGGDAEYLEEGSIQRVDGEVTYDVRKSRTDIMQYYFGVSVTF